MGALFSVVPGREQRKGLGANDEWVFTKGTVRLEESFCTGFKATSEESIHDRLAGFYRVLVAVIIAKLIALAFVHEVEIVVNKYTPPFRLSGRSLHLAFSSNRLMRLSHV